MTCVGDWKPHKLLAFNFAAPWCYAGLTATVEKKQSTVGSKVVALTDLLGH